MNYQQAQMGLAIVVEIAQINDRRRKVGQVACDCPAIWQAKNGSLKSIDCREGCGIYPRRDQTAKGSLFDREYCGIVCNALALQCSPQDPAKASRLGREKSRGRDLLRSVKGNKGWGKDIRVRSRRGGCQCGKKSPGRLPIHERERWGNGGVGMERGRKQRRDGDNGVLLGA